ncbi:MAG: hypothetical protein PHU77_00595 [Simplicispira sp.]|nr:hypothetical protein [Simplicispira sp.]
MTLLKSFAQGGMVAVVQVLRQRLIARRLQHVCLHIQKETALHRTQMAQLRAEQSALVVRLANAQARTAQTPQSWRALP